MRSLGYRVPPVWVGRDIRVRLGLGEEPEVTPIAEDHFLVRFENKEDCERALQEAPWVVGGQLLAVEPWRPAFVPSRRPVSRTVVWLRLPGLPVECWRSSLILAIAAEAGRPIALDSFTERQKKKGFARVKVEIDASRPVKPGVIVEAGEVRFWQQFQFENLPPICFLCRVMGHVEGGCSCQAQAVEEGKGSEDLGGGPRKPRLGPWISTSRIRQPRVSPTGGARMAGPIPGRGPSSSGPSSSPTGVNAQASPSPPDSEGWQKPSKVARKEQGVRGKGRKEGIGEELGVGGATSAMAFAPLAGMEDRMELGISPLPPSDSRMLEPDQSLLKRQRSPPESGRARQWIPSKPSTPSSSKSSKSSGNWQPLPGSSQGSSSPGIISASVPIIEGQVCHFSKPCMPKDVQPANDCPGDRKGDAVEPGDGVELIPVEVRLVSVVREGGVDPRWVIG